VPWWMPSPSRENCPTDALCGLDQHKSVTVMLSSGCGRLPEGHIL
jgi:hypothetical protein